MLSKIGYYLLKGISRMPFWFIYALSDVASWVLCYVVRYRRKTVLDNLRLCFPEQSPAWRRRVARRFYRGFSDTMLEALKMFTLSPQKAKERLRYENPQEFEQMLASGRNHIMVFGHYANWEWLMFTKLLYPRMRTIALYQRIENAFVNDCALHARERFGMEAMQAKHALLGLARLKNDGETMVAFVADQSPARPLIKHWTKFFGVETPVHIGVHSLAVALKYDVIFLDMRRASRGTLFGAGYAHLHSGRAGCSVRHHRPVLRPARSPDPGKARGLALVASPLEVLPPWGGRRNTSAGRSAEKERWRRKINPCA